MICMAVFFVQTVNVQHDICIKFGWLYAIVSLHFNQSFVLSFFLPLEPFPYFQREIKKEKKIQNQIKETKHNNQLYKKERKTENLLQRAFNRTVKL